MDHFNIVKLYEVYEDDKNFYLIMDLIKGGELFELIVKRQRLSQIDSQNIVMQILMATNYMHKKGFIHRDLKPENICIDEDKNIKIIDFGTSRNFKNNRYLK